MNEKSASSDSSFAAMIVSDNRKLARAMLFVLFVWLVLFFSVYGFIEFFDVRKIAFVDDKTVITIQDREITGVLIHPSGWTDSEFTVQQGDSIDLSASGKTNLSLGSLVELYSRYGELRKIKGKNNEDRKIEDFSQNEISELEDLFPKRSGKWIGPTGIDDALPRREKILTSAPFGVLLVYIADQKDSGCPNLDQKVSEDRLIVYRGNPTKFKADRDGILCFAVNDLIVTGKNELRTKIHWIDNEGFLSIRIVREK